MRFFRNTALLLAAMLLCGSAFAAPEGHYAGQFDGQPVSADLELMDTTLIGILVVGEERFLVNADRDGNAYRGQVTDMTTREKSPLQITDQGSSIRVQLNAGSPAERAMEMRFR